MFGRYRRSPAIVSDPALLNSPQSLIDPQDPNDPLGLGYGPDGSPYWEPDGTGYLGEEEDGETLIREIGDRDAYGTIRTLRRIHAGFHDDTDRDMARYTARNGPQSNGLMVVGCMDRNGNIFPYEDEGEDLNPGDLIEDIRARGRRPVYHLGAGSLFGEDWNTGNELENAILRGGGKGAYRLGVFGVDDEDEEPEAEVSIYYNAKGKLRSRHRTKHLAKKNAMDERHAYKQLGRQTRRLQRVAEDASEDMDDISFPGDPQEGASAAGFRKYGDTIITNPAFLNSAQDFYGPNLGNPRDTSEGFRKYGDTIITNPAFLNAAQDFYGSDLGDPFDTSEGLMVIGNIDDFR